MYVDPSRRTLVRSTVTLSVLYMLAVLFGLLLAGQLPKVKAPIRPAEAQQRCVVGQTSTRCR